MDNQQQPNQFQWPQQDFQYQPPGPPNPQMPQSGQPMPMPGPSQSTPDLNTMYPQHPQIGQQSAQQNFAQQPYVQHPQQQVPFDQALPAQQQQYQDLLAGQGAFVGQAPQQASYDAATAANPHGQSQQQFPQQPFLNPQPAPKYPVPPPQTPHPHPAPSQTASLYTHDPLASAWEQQNITEVHNPLHSPAATSRAHALRSAHARIRALETDLERRETATALALSASQQREQDVQDLHEALLASLDSYEQDLRRQLAQEQGQERPHYAASTPPPVPEQSSRSSEASWRSPTPRAYTPTRGVGVEAAGRNRAAEEGRRWAGFGRVRRGGGRGADGSGGSETVGRGEG